MTTAVTIEQLLQAGLVDGSEVPQLTLKGRDWLRHLEDVETQEVTDLSESAADFVLSTNGLFR